MRSRPETRFGRIFLYIHFLDSDRGLIGFFRVTESSQDISDEDPAKKQKCSFEASFIEVNLFLSSIALTSRPNAPADRLPYKRLLAQSFPDAKPFVASSTVVGPTSRAAGAKPAGGDLPALQPPADARPLTESLHRRRAAQRRSRAPEPPHALPVAGRRRTRAGPHLAA